MTDGHGVDDLAPAIRAKARAEAFAYAANMAEERAERVRVGNTHRGRIGHAAEFCVGQLISLAVDLRNKAGSHA